MIIDHNKTLTITLPKGHYINQPDLDEFKVGDTITMLEGQIFELAVPWFDSAIKEITIDGETFNFYDDQPHEYSIQVSEFRTRESCTIPAIIYADDWTVIDFAHIEVFKNGEPVRNHPLCNQIIVESDLRFPPQYRFWRLITK